MVSDLKVLKAKVDEFCSELCEICVIRCKLKSKEKKKFGIFTCSFRRWGKKKFGIFTCSFRRRGKKRNLEFLHVV